MATTNKGKIRFYGSKLKERGVELLTLQDLNIYYDVEETGNKPVDNAIIKAKTYARLSGMIKIALDEGLYLENVFNDIQPGTNVRRVNGKRLSDKEMIEYYTG